MADESDRDRLIAEYREVLAAWAAAGRERAETVQRQHEASVRLDRAAKKLHEAGIDRAALEREFFGG